MQSRALRWGLAVVGAVVLAACGGGGGGGNGGSGGGPAPSPTVSGVTIEPGVVDLARGSSTEFRLRASYSDGSDRLIDDSVSWQSADTSVAAVNRVTAGIAPLVGYNPGTTLINARWSGHSAALQLRVGAAEIVALELQSPSGAMAVGAEAGLRLFARYTDGTRAEHTALANWTSDDPTVVEVRENAAGGQLARALQVGQAR